MKPQHQISTIFIKLPWIISLGTNKRSKLCINLIIKIMIIPFHQQIIYLLHLPTINTYQLFRGCYNTITNKLFPSPNELYWFQKKIQQFQVHFKHQKSC
jgi:hypothetical protein